MSCYDCRVSDSLFVFFFFSSRRRHTRFDCDWSSDVCSSDLDLGTNVRIGSRTGEVPFDWDDDTTWAPALDGVDSAYVCYYPDVSFPGAAGRVAGFARTAVAHGARRLVMLSGRGEPEAVPAEDGVRGSGAEWTVLRCAWFAQNFSEHFLLQPVLDGVIALPAADVAEPFLDVDDVADAPGAGLSAGVYLPFPAVVMPGRRKLPPAHATSAMSSISKDPRQPRW